MVEKEKTLKIRKIGSFLEIDDKWYFPKQQSRKDKKGMIFKEVDKKTVENNLKFLVKTLRPYLDKGMILEDALAELKPRDLMKLTESLKTGKRPKVRSKYGCIDFIVNGVEVPIR
jgi:hypothetical protein